MLGIFAVYRLSLALSVWSVRMALGSGLHNISFSVNSLVRDDAAPVERFDDILFCSGYKALRVSVFDADNEISSTLFCKEIII